MAKKGVIKCIFALKFVGRKIVLCGQTVGGTLGLSYEQARFLAAGVAYVFRVGSQCRLVAISR